MCKFFKNIIQRTARHHSSSPSNHGNDQGPSLPAWSQHSSHLLADIDQSSLSSRDLSDNHLSSFPEEPMTFSRHTSTSSTSSLALGGRYTKTPKSHQFLTPQRRGSLTHEQQRELIRRVIAMSKGRLASMKYLYGPPSPERGQSPYDPHVEMAAERGQSPDVFMVKRSSHHKLVKMSNVSSVDLCPSDSPPSPIHHPIQRGQSDMERRFVRGGTGSSITMQAQSPPQEPA